MQKKKKKKNIEENNIIETAEKVIERTKNGEDKSLQGKEIRHSTMKSFVIHHERHHT